MVVRGITQERFRDGISDTLSHRQVTSTLPWPEHLKGRWQRGVSSESCAAESKSLLLYGREATLLKTRSLVLQATGFTVYTAENSLEAECLIATHHLDAFILCHSVPFEEASGVLSNLRALRHTVKSLVLIAAEPSLLAISADDVHRTSDGPKALATMIQSLWKPSTHTH